MKAALCIDDAVGELRRALLDEQGRPFRLEVERWGERGKRGRLDEVWWGRATARMPGGRGWFIDLGLANDGVLETKASIPEGAIVPIRIKSEEWADKGPVLSLADMPRTTPRPDRPGLHSQPSEDPFFTDIELSKTFTGEEARCEIDAAIEEALAPSVAIYGGGRLTIEATQALTAIDVDASDRPQNGEGEFDLVLNLAAADQAARQISLRAIGGLVIVDFVSMARRQERDDVAERFRDCLALRLGRASTVLDLSQLGLCEAAVARRMRPTADAHRAGAAEREGLDALRMIESAGVAARGARIRTRLSSDAAKWLEDDRIGWKAALADRIGARWLIETESRLPGRPSVWSE